MRQAIVLMGPPCMELHQYAWFLHEEIQTTNCVVVSFFDIAKKTEAQSSILGFDNYDKCFNHFYQKVEEAINKMGHNDILIAEGFFLLRAERMKLLDLISPQIDKIIGIWTEKKYHDLVELNLKRKEIDQDLMDVIFEYRVSPRVDEPFDDIYYLIIDSDIGLSKEHPYFNTVEDNLRLLVKECEEYANPKRSVGR